MFNRSDAKNRIDNKLLEQHKAEVAYSSAALERVVAVIKHLQSVGIPFEDMMNSWDLSTTGTTWEHWNFWPSSILSLQPILRNMEGKVRGQCHSSPLRSVMCCRLCFRCNFVFQLCTEIVHFFQCLSSSLGYSVQ